MSLRRRVALTAIALSIAAVAILAGARFFGGETPTAPANPRTPSEVIEAWHAAVQTGDTAATKGLSCKEVERYVEGVVEEVREDRELRDHYDLSRHQIIDEVIDSDQAVVTVRYELWRDGPELRHNVIFKWHLLLRNGWKYCGSWANTDPFP